MIKTYADNAVMAKVRALYGKRLKESDYSQLLGKKTVAEVASYLKKETYYAETLGEVKEELIHREQLETFVRRRILNTYTKLLAYSRQETLFLTLYIMDNEIEQLLMAIRLLNSGSIDRYIVSLPVYLAKLMSFDLFRLAKAASFDDLLDTVEHSDYYRLLGRFRPTTLDKRIDITLCEAAFITYYNEKALELTRRDYHGETREDLEQLFRFRVAIHNMALIFRMRRYLNVGAEIIGKRLVQIEGDRYGRLYQQLMMADDLAQMQRILGENRVFKRHPVDWTGDSRKISAQIFDARQAINQRLYRFSSKPVITVISYMTLLEIEVNNITNITEGIRYGLPPSEIRGLLTIG